MKTQALLLAFAVSFSSLAQTLSTIEAVEYDPAGDRWFVSNNSSILETSDGGESWVYFGNGSASHGMEVLGDVLYVLKNSQLRAYDLTTAELVSTANFSPTPAFLNGMGNDGENLLVISDFGSSRIYTADVSDPENIVTTMITSVTGAPIAFNGVVVDTENNRAIVVSWGSNAKIYEVDLVTGDYSILLLGTGLGNLDGIDVDSEGNYYVSSWSPPRITKYNSDFTESETVVSSGLSSPADICYSIETDTLGVANSGSSQVTFHFFGTDDVQDISTSTEFDINLTGEELIFNINRPATFELLAYSIEGKVMAREDIQLLQGMTRVQLSRLPQGFTNARLITVIALESGTHTYRETFKQGLRQL
jgi:hypothetical protein|tara:strand:- start:61 stop:1149 length:1089 start_codon:yes stop_codon:yes gene_type:complete